MKKPSILLADDHTILLEGLKSLLESKFELAGSVEDGRALLAAAEKLKPDVILLDISMPLLNGIEAARRLKKANVKAKLVFLTMHSDIDFVKEAFRAGASGYLLKRSVASELVTAIQQVLRGRSYVTPLITRNLVNSFLDLAADAQKHGSKLAPRQREVLQMVAEGRPLKEIAGILNISVSTVEFHKSTVMQKLGLHSNAELIKYAIDHGIGTP